MAHIVRITCAAEARHPVRYDSASGWYRHEPAYAFCPECRIVDGAGQMRSQPTSAPAGMTLGQAKAQIAQLLEVGAPDEVFAAIARSQRTDRAREGDYV